MQFGMSRIKYQQQVACMSWTQIFKNLGAINSIIGTILIPPINKQNNSLPITES